MHDSMNCMLVNWMHRESHSRSHSLTYSLTQSTNTHTHTHTHLHADRTFVIFFCWPGYEGSVMHKHWAKQWKKQKKSRFELIFYVAHRAVCLLLIYQNLIFCVLIHLLLIAMQCSIQDYACYSCEFENKQIKNNLLIVNENLLRQFTIKHFLVIL